MPHPCHRIGLAAALILTTSTTLLAPAASATPTASPARAASISAAPHRGAPTTGTARHRAASARTTTPAARRASGAAASVTSAGVTVPSSPTPAALAAVASTAGPVSAPNAVVVAPWGSNRNSGSSKAPLRTLKAGLEAVRPGGTLFVRIGTYDERIINPEIARAAATNRITVTAWPGERPVLRGLLWLTNADYWTISGLDIRWSDTNDASEHMVKMISGRGWRLTGNTISGAHSYAGLLVAGTATGWSVDGNTIRSTYASNGINQDHLMYVNTTGTDGVVERNLLTDSPNGQAIKVGPPNAEAGQVTGRLTIRYNTMRDNKGPANVQLSHVTSNVDIYRNVFVSPAAGRSAVAAWDLRGWNNTVHDNVYWDAVRPVDTTWSGLKDTGGNVRQDPSTAVGYGFAG